MHGMMVRIAAGVIGLLSIAMLLLAIFNDKGALQVRAQSQKLTTIQADIQKVEHDNKQLGDEIKALKTNPAAIEKLAREELKLVKPGEVVIATPEK
jgi:cell division protein FtsB